MDRKAGRERMFHVIAEAEILLKEFDDIKRHISAESNVCWSFSSIYFYINIYSQFLANQKEFLKSKTQNRINNVDLKNLLCYSHKEKHMHFSCKSKRRVYFKF